MSGASDDTEQRVQIIREDFKMNDNDKVNHLDRLIKKLKKPIKINNNEPLLVDDITDKYYETKYMGFAKYKDNPFRRIDIRFVAHDVFPSALLYFTGSDKFNIQIRKKAIELGYSLSEHGLKITKKDVPKPPEMKNEKDILDFLEIAYIEPKKR